MMKTNVLFLSKEEEQQINEAAKSIRAELQDLDSDRIDLKKCLVRAKKMIPQEKWGEWVRTEMGLSPDELETALSFLAEAVA